MNARARGFSLVELLVVSVMLTVIMGAVYKTLISQQQSTRHLSAVITTQQTNRTAAQFLAGEMRELGTTVAGDILMASADSIRFRALRKAAVVCNMVAGGSTSVDVFSLGDTIAVNDSVAIYADKGTPSLADDSLFRAQVTNIATATCPALGAGPTWTSMNAVARRLTLSPAPANVFQGALVRTYTPVTYGRYVKGTTPVFGRRLGADTAVTLIGPLASGSTGFALQYYNVNAASLATPVTAANLPGIVRIRLTIRGESKGAVTSTGTYSTPLVTDISLRGN